MANRTLRRKPNSANKPSSGDGSEPDNVAGNIIGDADSASGADGRVADDDSIVDDAERGVADSARGSVRSGVVEIDPAELQRFIADGDRGDTPSDGSDTGDGRRQRKPRGPNKRARQAPQTIDVAAIQMLCNTLFVIARQPELALDDTEAKTISDAYAEFSKYHEVPGISPKRISEFNLAGALLTVFGTRAVAIFRSGRKPTQKQAQVVNIQGGVG